MNHNARRPKRMLVGSRTALSRARKQRHLKRSASLVSALSDDVLGKMWDNPEDAMYDRWREIYGIRKR